MPRNAQPIDVLVAKGKKHLTKKEIEDRKKAEIKLGLTDLEKLQPPAFVKNDVVAFRCWKKHLEEYIEAAKNGIEIITTSDAGMLALYCKTYSEYENLIALKKRIEKKILLEDILKLETAINKKMDMLIKMQDRLFLNPLAKVKNVPKKQKEDPKNPMEEEFDI